MLVLALPAKSFQLYFNFIQSATSPFFLPALSRIFVQMAADGRKKEHTSLLSIIRVELRDDGGEREREITRDFQFLHNNGDCSIPRGIAANL